VRAARRDGGSLDPLEHAVRQHQLVVRHLRTLDEGDGALPASQVGGDRDHLAAKDVVLEHQPTKVAQEATGHRVVARDDLHG
jgi:hypothetical protein